MVFLSTSGKMSEWYLKLSPQLLPYTLARPAQLVAHRQQVSHDTVLLPTREKIKLFLSTPKTHIGVEVHLHLFLASALEGGEWSVLHLKLFFPWAKGHPCSSHCIGGWVGSRTCLDILEKTLFSFWKHIPIS